MGWQLWPLAGGALGQNGQDGDLGHPATLQGVEAVKATACPAPTCGTEGKEGANPPQPVWYTANFPTSIRILYSLSIVNINFKGNGRAPNLQHEMNYFTTRQRAGSWLQPGVVLSLFLSSSSSTLRTPPFFFYYYYVLTNFIAHFICSQITFSPSLQHINYLVGFPHAVRLECRDWYRSAG